MIFSLSAYGADKTMIKGDADKIKFDKSLYTHILVGDNDYVAVSKDGRLFGYVDLDGKEILPSTFKIATEFKNGRAVVVRDKNVEFINKKFDILEKYENPKYWRYLFDFGGIDVLELAYAKESNHKASVWAREYALVADNMGIVSDELKAKYKKNISREEFAEILVKTLINKSDDTRSINREKLLKMIDEANKDDELLKFEDTSNDYVRIAFKMGIVQGRSEKTFDPEGEITRQEAAVMLIRAYKLIQDKLILDKLPEYSLEKISSGYSDSNLMATWAKEDVFFSKHTKLMNGVGGGKFDPLGKFTVEQSIATMLRLYAELL